MNKAKEKYLVEDAKILQAAARAASKQANRENNALGLVNRVGIKGVIYDKHPDGTLVKIAEMNKQHSIRSIKKGTVLYAKK